MSRRALPVRLKVGLARHLQVALASLGELTRRPLSSLLTALVIAIALALPAGLHQLVVNLGKVAGGWDGAPTLSLFLQLDTQPAAAHDLADRVRTLPNVAAVDYISPEAALAEFRERSGLAEVIDLLDENPLPPVLVVQLTRGAERTDAARLQADLAAMEAVDLAQLDLAWVERLQAILVIIDRTVMVLALLLAVGVVLIVGNTLRLAIAGRREEIEIMKLIGGTDAFIRRPFLYTGFWYGLIGGLLGSLMMVVALALLAGPVHHLATLYQSDFRLTLFEPVTLSLLPLAGALLGLLAAWFTVSRHLRAIHPGE